MRGGNYEVVVGLEVHVQLSTRAKLFCGCSTRYGAEPNTQVCSVCLGYPGALPVLNRRAVRLAVRAALAFEGKVARFTKFDRKNYFYPDLPKGYQISQFDRPVVEGGRVRFVGVDGEDRVIALTRIHLEEDAGKSIHEEEGNRSLIDLNRCGTPLLEMVTEPELRSGSEAASCTRTIRDIMRWIGVSDANMEEGSLRCDVNISLRPRGSLDLGTRTEIKNLNSFTHVQRAVEVEAKRQAGILSRGEAVNQETRLYDPDRDQTSGMRGKEESHDYRYFPEPDLAPVMIPESLIEEEQAALPELPRARRRRYEKEHEISPEISGPLVESRAMADYFDAVVTDGAPPREACKWLQEVRRYLNDTHLDVAELSVSGAELATIIEAVGADKVSVATGREIFRDAASSGEKVAALLSARGEQVSDASELEAWIDQVIGEHADAADKVRQGDDKPIAFLMGQVMRLSRGQANPRRVSEILKERLA